MSIIEPPQGRSLRIFLADGSPFGIRHAELVNWSGQALVCPRSRFKSLAQWEEAQRPGVYFLIGSDPETDADLLYIGEAENVRTRLETHLRTNDFWRTALLFTSKDENLTKSHVKYLESRLIAHVRALGRVQLQNSVTPALPRLPRADRVDMEGFLAPIVTLAGALGFRFLEQSRPQESEKRSSQDTDEDGGSSGVFSFSRGEYCSAQGFPNDEGFLLLRGARGPVAQRDHAGPSRQKRMEQLRAEGAIEISGKEFITTKDVAFSSPSGAAAFVAGGSVNGRKEWKLETGQSLAEWEEQELELAG